MVDSRSTGQSPSGSCSSSSKKEKKKLAKEERDRQKQAEKKKRRLEKALATATAIRIELEQKKQKRKEEEQRLDEEGAALAEAVALQVLVEEDRAIQTSDSNLTELENMCDPKPFSSLRRKEVGQQIVVKERDINGRHIRILDTREIDDQSWINFRVFEGRSVLKNDEFYQGEAFSCYAGESTSSIEEEFRVTSKRARDAEIAAGLAAARAVAALRIAEEARAEAEAARIAAELSMAKSLEKRNSSQMDRILHESILQPKSAEEERNELKAQLLQMEHALQEKTKKVLQLEQDLEYVKEYLTGCEATTSNSNNNDASEESTKREPEISSITATKSFGDSADF